MRHRPAANGVAVRVVLPDGSLLPRAGRINFMAPSLDSASGTQEFRAQFANADRRLLPGQFVRVRLEGFSRASALAVPQRAVQQGLGRQFVYVVGAGDTVIARDVKPGPWSGNLWIIDSGLVAGDRVVVDGIQKIAPGRVVKPVPVGGFVVGCRPQERSHERHRHRRRRARTTGPDRTEPRGRRAQPEIRYFFIRRPVLGAVISIVITLLGLFAIQLLPIARYPQITPPAVRIQANYPGASSEDAAQAVAAPIEEQLAGLQGMLYYASSNSSDGSTNITVTFDVSRNQDLAAVDVQNAVKLAEPQLPDAVRTNGITILKANTDILVRRRAPVGRSAVRRDVSRELSQAQRRRRDQARAGRRRRDAVPGARLRDAPRARSGEDGAARASRSATSPRRCASRTRRIPPADWAPSRRRRARSSRCRSRRSAA